jgi:uncharacterized membrane protein
MGMPQDPKTSVFNLAQQLSKFQGPKANFAAAGCGCMGMPKDPKTKDLWASGGALRPGGLTAAGCGCGGMAQDPKTKDLWSSNRFQNPGMF